MTNYSTQTLQINWFSCLVKKSKTNTVDIFKFQGTYCVIFYLNLPEVSWNWNLNCANKILKSWWFFSLGIDVFFFYSAWIAAIYALGETGCLNSISTVSYHYIYLYQFIHKISTLMSILNVWLQSWHIFTFLLLLLNKPSEYLKLSTRYQDFLVLQKYKDRKKYPKSRYLKL